MQVTVITIGDELLIGQVVDTNSAYMARLLNEAGISLYETVSVHDDAEHILSSLDKALSDSDLVLLTGGLGPTKDDITKLTLARYFKASLRENEAVKKHVLDLYKDRPTVLNRLTQTQWQVPENAVILENRVGSAPIMLWELRREGKEKIVVSMPGVPHEMQIAMEEQVMPWLKKHLAGLAEHILHRNVLVYGVPESAIEVKIQAWEDALPAAVHLAYLPKNGIVRLRLSAYGDVNEQEIDRLHEELADMLRDHVIATEDQPVEVLVGEQLRRLHATVATAESCTGGKLAVLLNRHSGSSDFYWGSVVAYDNSVKQHVLGVSEQTLRDFGAVSRETVTEMAEGVRCLMHTDYAIATSGVAGPTGGTPDKPVGTVWVAVATPSGTETQLLHLGTQREQNTDRATTAALVMLMRILQSR